MIFSFYATNGIQHTFNTKGYIYTESADRLVKCILAELLWVTYPHQPQTHFSSILITKTWLHQDVFHTKTEAVWN